MEEIDQRNERVCDGVLYYSRGDKAVVEDRRKAHSPVEMIYVGIGQKEHATEEVEPFYIFECPACGHIRSI